MNNKASSLSEEKQIQLLESLIRTRLVEERIVALYPEQEMRCPTHLSIGQEAAAVGVCDNLESNDYAISAHRSHAHYLCKGGDLKRMFAELYGKESGCAKGKGGSMHLIDLSVGFLGCVPIVGSTIPIGVGAAFGVKMRGEDRVTAIFFGDGAIETGVFHESVNFAMVQNLPILFVCENNLYSVNTPLAPRQPSTRSICDLVGAHGIPVDQVDGQDVEIVLGHCQKLYEHVKTGNGPAFIECLTYRWFEHCGPLYDIHLGFRPEGEYERWQQKDPVTSYSEKLISRGTLGQEDIAKLYRRYEGEIDEAVEYAKSSPFPQRDALVSEIYAA